MAPVESAVVVAIKENCYPFRKVLRQQKGLPGLKPSRKVPDVQDLYDELRRLRNERSSVWTAREQSYKKMADGEADRRTFTERELRRQRDTALAAVRKLSGELDFLLEAKQQRQVAATSLVHQLAEVRQELKVTEQQRHEAAQSALGKGQRVRRLEEELSTEKRRREEAVQARQQPQSQLANEASQAKARAQQLEEAQAEQRWSQEEAAKARHESQQARKAPARGQERVEQVEKELGAERRRREEAVHDKQQAQSQAQVRAQELEKAR